MLAFRSNGIRLVNGSALAKTLRWLILTDNKITELPVEIGMCQDMQVCMCVCLCMFVYVCMYAYANVSVCTCVCACMYAYAYVLSVRARKFA